MPASPHAWASLFQDLPSKTRRAFGGGSIHEFKGLEAPAVILTDVDLSKEYHRDLLYVGASRATDRLVVLEQRGAGGDDNCVLTTDPRPLQFPVP